MMRVMVGSPWGLGEAVGAVLAVGPVAPGGVAGRGGRAAVVAGSPGGQVAFRAVLASGPVVPLGEVAG
ncbi:hypothetical protein [Amycolatopsis saalfeldensis]|uniref:hypothetical protein n=1 Tax=Amycolatopsis saalfeldensis TaxID=394193 RepID=UPI000B890E69|nr:hypothetical protein [Amycolatopsis saalfeldensis]